MGENADPGGGVAPDRPSRWRLAAPHGLLILLGTWSVFGGWIRGGFIGDPWLPVDSHFNHYVLEHVYRSLLDGIGYREHAGSLWSPPMFHPVGGTLAYSDNLFGTAPLYWLARLFVSDVAAFQAWRWLALVLTYAATAWAAGRLGASRVAAAVAGFGFAFGMPRIAQIDGGHDQMIPQMFAPLAIAAAWSFVLVPRVRMLAALLGLLAWQVAAGVYLGWFVILGVAAALPFAYARADRRRALYRFARRSWLPASLVMLMAAGVMASLLWPYVVAGRDFEPWGDQYIANTLPRWHSYLQPTPHTLWSPLLGDIGAGEGFVWELRLFAGFGWLVPLAAAVVALSGRRGWQRGGRHLVAVLLIAALGLTLATLRLPSGFSAWWRLHEWIPGGDSIRAVARIWSATYLMALLAAAVGASAWLRARPSPRWPRVVLAVAAGVFVIEQVCWARPAADRDGFRDRVAALEQRLDDADDRPFFVFPDDAEEPSIRRAHATAIWAALAEDVPTVNGYSARPPPGYPMERTVPGERAVRAWHRERGGDGELRFLPVTGAADGPHPGRQAVGVGR